MRNLFVLALLLFSLVFAFADQHYVCTQSGDLDRWDVPTWKQDSVFSMGYTIYVDCYDTVCEVRVKDNSGNDVCMCKKDQYNECTIVCEFNDRIGCKNGCICKFCLAFTPEPPDGTEVKDLINKIVDSLIGIY